MDYFLFNFSGVQFHYTMSHQNKYKNKKTAQKDNLYSKCLTEHRYTNPSLLAEFF